jgi:hypothetical protein
MIPFPAGLWGKVKRMSSLLGPDTVGAGWRKPSYSMSNGACVEAASDFAFVAVRDSADPGAAVVTYAAPAWNAFVTAVKAGAFDYA